MLAAPCYDRNVANRRAVFAGVSVVALGGGLVALLVFGGHKAAPPARVVAAVDANASFDEDESDMLSFRTPTGKPAALSCDDAHLVLEQVRDEMLAYDPPSVTPSALASGIEDWMDPYGLWTAAPDSPVARSIDTLAPELLREVQGGSRCESALLVGKEQVAWVGSLQLEFEQARAKVSSHPHAWSDALAEVARDDEPARELARDLGERLGAVEREIGPAATPYVDLAAARFLPTMSDKAWAEVSLAAAVRAYVPLVDPHGAWAPNGEESSVYDLDLEAHPPDRAWTKASRTTIGIRIDDGARAPLQVGDVVLEVDGLATAGLPPEQVDQIAFVAATPEISVVRVPYRRAEVERVQMVAQTDESFQATDSPSELDVKRVPYGSAGDVALITIPDVPDDLGARFVRALQAAKHGSAPLVGVVIDLRGNGGGSTEGAIDVLATVLPGAPLFPMKRRDGTIETDRAPTSTELYRGPLATLVDPATASAAEMLAGALGAYHRAAIVGTSTYGKGCAQEYADDAVHAGVLRLTTLLYALPDGSPVQRVGLVPWAHVPFVAVDLDPTERETTLPHAPPSWSGLDVRDREVLKKSAIAWPAAMGSIGPCKEPRVCEALGMLASATPHDVHHAATAKH